MNLRVLPWGGDDRTIPVVYELRAVTLFDIHAERHRLKLLKDTGHTTLVESRDEVACPVCKESFHRALLTERPGRSFDDVDGAFCVGRDDERLYVFTHPGNAVR